MKYFIFLFIFLFQLLCFSQKKNISYGVIINPNALVYEDPNFDSKVVFRFSAQKMLLVSKKIYYGPNRFGSFYKVKWSKNRIGFVADTDIKILSNKRNKSFLGADLGLAYQEKNIYFQPALRLQSLQDGVIWDLSLSYNKLSKDLFFDGFEITAQAGLNFTYFLVKKAYIYSLIGAYLHYSKFSETEDEKMQTSQSLGLSLGGGLGTYFGKIQTRLELKASYHNQFIYRMGLHFLLAI